MGTIKSEGYQSANIKIECHNDFVILKGYSEPIMKYDIKKNTFVDLD